MKEVLHFYYLVPINTARFMLIRNLFSYVLLVLWLLLSIPNVYATEKTSTIDGVISTIGSDTLSRLVSQWTEALQQNHPGIRLELHSGGSSTAATALISGTTIMAPMSRRMSDQEQRLFARQHGYPVTEIPIAEDRIMVFVHPDNSLTELSLAELDAIFSSTRLRGYPNPITHWHQLPSTYDWSNRAIEVYSRSVTSGTYGDFRELALAGGDFINRLIELPGSLAVVRGVASSKNAIGFASFAYLDSQIKPLAISLTSEESSVAVTDQESEYPLSRILYLYLNHPPNTELPPHYAYWLAFVLSEQGKAILLSSGLTPL
ncbi:MAG: PstS family phosphate ABC transporter substrate-binding protein [Oceanospirillales bacterium]|nr:MAG: PstS family phosphate ABC transporter substrate-binding protein [Oceanospirillales bacterium]